MKLKRTNAGIDILYIYMGMIRIKKQLWREYYKCYLLNKKYQKESNRHEIFKNGKAAVAVNEPRK